jgi:hypothetical protein
MIAVSQFMIVKDPCKMTKMLERFMPENQQHAEKYTTPLKIQVRPPIRKYKYSNRDR